MVTLREINRKNFDECIRLDVDEKQKSFVASNLFSLAEAWLNPTIARPYAIYHDEAMVGFTMLNIDFQEDGLQKVCEIWRLMIDKRYQKQGFGRAAMEAILRLIRENPRVETARITYEPDNTVAERLYQSFGFAPNGELDGDEIVLVLELHG